MWKKDVVCAAAGAVLCAGLCASNAHAQEFHAGLDLQGATQRAFDDRSQRTALEVNSATLPRFDSTDTASRAKRVDLSLLSEGRSSIGPSLGLTNAEAASFNPAMPAPTPSSVDVGVHWRYMPEGAGRVDVRAWRRMTPADSPALLAQATPDTSYGARVEMQVSAPKKGFVTDNGFVGMQLESGARITVHKSRGVPMLYYRAGF